MENDNNNPAQSPEQVTGEKKEGHINNPDESKMNSTKNINPKVEQKVEIFPLKN